MNIQFATAESAFCPKLKTREGYEQHVLQPHLPISSLLCPAEPLKVSHFPIAICSATEVFNPVKIANLWLQLLVIQVQNGNFWNYEDVVKAQTDKAYEKALATWKTARTTPVDEVAVNPKPEKLDTKALLFLRHKLQKGFLSRDTAAVIEEVSTLSDFIKKLEDAPDLDPTDIKTTKIHKVLIAICKLDTIPGDEEFKIRERCEPLIAKWREMISEDFIAAWKAERETEAAATKNATPQPIEPQPHVSETPTDTEEANQTPAVCLTQLTPEQCAKVEALAQACDPPLDRAVVELMCMLPQFSALNEHETYQIVPFGQLRNPIEDLESKGDSWRKFDHWGAKTPSHMLQLTEWVEGHYGIAFFVDTRTSEGIVFREYQVLHNRELDHKWEHLVGERKPVEELLQEWIDEFLIGKFMPSGGIKVHQEGPRSIVDILMDLRKHNAFLQEYDWPTSFPLPAPQYNEFLKRKNELDKTTFHKNPRHHHSLAYKWGSVSAGWRPTHNPFIKYDASDVSKYELLSALDRQIRSALDFHEKRIEDQKYALAADVPMQKQFMQLLTLRPSSSSGYGWKVDTSPEMLLQRLDEVYAASPEAVDEDTGKMREILERAYERWKLSEQGIYERDWVEGEDDDSTSDYDPVDEEMDDEDDEEYEDDEVLSDLDAGVLEADMADDVEVVRARLEGYQIESE